MSRASELADRIHPRTDWYEFDAQTWCNEAAAELHRLDRDAERYRWLRGQPWTENTLAVVLRPKDNTKLGCFLPFGELLDETIDRFASGAALTSATKEQQK